MRHLLAACLIAAAPLAFAETLTSDDGRLAARLELSDALVGHPAFAAFLKDEALAIRDDAASFAAEEGASGWRLTVRDQVSFSNAAFASSLRVVDQTGLVRAVSVEPLIWDAGAGDFARLDRFFDAGRNRDDALSAITFRLGEGIAQRVWGGNVPGEWRPRVQEAIQPDAAILSNVTLASGTAAGKAAGLTFHFNPGEIAPVGEPLAFTLPYSVFAIWLNADGRALFGGELRR